MADLPAKQNKALTATHSLSSLHKKIKKHSAKAIETLIDIIDSEDSSAAEKKDAAKFLLSLQVDMEDKINKDSLQKTIIALRMQQQNERLGMKDVGDSGQPYVIYNPNAVIDGDLVENGGRNEIETEIDLSRNDLSNM